MSPAHAVGADIPRAIKADKSIYATPARASVAILIIAGLGLFVYEATKSYLLPRLTLWESHSVTIAFGSVVASLAAYSALRKQSALHEQLLYQFSERLRVEADSDALRLSEHRYRHLVEQSPEAILVHSTGNVLYANSACLRLIGADALTQVASTLVESWIHVEDRDALNGRLDQLVLGKGEHRPDATATYRLISRNGDTRLVEIASVRITHDGASAVQTVMRDVTDKARLEKELFHQAFHDALTGLSNRALFYDRVEHAMTRLQRDETHRQRVVVLFLDLDHFKTVNDSLGHAVGDALLVAVALRLLAVTRGCDSVARLGGDEFAVLLEDAGNQSDPAIVAERIVECMRAPFVLDNTSVALGMSVGIATAQHADETDALLRNADLALYAAKEQGRARHVEYAPSMHATAVERLSLEGDLRPAVERLSLIDDASHGDIRIVYQPVVDLKSGTVTGVEALARWTRPGRGAVSPAVFIPVAEETGLIVQLGTWILHKACRQAVQWESLGVHGYITMGVNVSRRQFQEPDFVDVVREALATSQLEPSRLMLEITEGLMMDDANATLSRLRDLKTLGILLAVDDFGTGYSSLSYLRQFPIDILKIDKSFIDGLGNGKDEAQIANAIVSLGAALSLTTIAEGIEDATQLRRLQALGCERGQGYYFAHPLSAQAVAERLEAGAFAAGPV